jgi:drug/metabolite transporter (DMT)-like permease
MMHAMTKRTQVFLAFASVYLFWGSTFVAIRYVAQLLHPAFISGFRCVIAGSILMAYLLLRGLPVALSPGDWWRVSLLGFIMFTINNTLVSYGGRILSSGLTALLIASIPLFIALMEVALPGRTSMTRIGWIGTVGGFLGLAVLTHHSVRGQSLTSETVLACAALIIAAVAWALGSILSKHLHIHAASLLSTAWQMLIAGSINLLLAVSFGGLRTSHFTPAACLILLYLAIFGSIASYTSYTFLLRNVRLSAAATYAYVNPVVAVVLGWALLHETLHGTEWLGMAIVLTSVAMVLASKPKPAQ